MLSAEKIKLLVKQAHYSLRVNSGLDAAESKTEYERFVSQMKKSLETQVKEISENEKLLHDLFFLLQKTEPNTNLVSFLGKAWVSIEAIFQILFGEEELLRFYIWAGNEGGQSVLDRMGIELTFELRNDAVTRYLSDRKNLMIKSVDDTTKELLAKTIEEARNGFLSVFETQQLIEEKFSEINKNRAETIARTETAEAFNAVELETYRQNGAKKMRWITVLDERVCPICEPLHNSEVRIGELFPGLSKNRPPAHVNCRCFLEEVIVGVSIRADALSWTGA